MDLNELLNRIPNEKKMELMGAVMTCRSLEDVAGLVKQFDLPISADELSGLMELAKGFLGNFGGSFEDLAGSVMGMASSMSAKEEMPDLSQGIDAIAGELFKKLK